MQANPIRSGRAFRLKYLAAAALLGMASAASAISFDELDAAGNVVRSYAPSITDWVLAPDASQSAVTALAGGGFAVDMGTSSWGVVESGSQARQISGAGVLLPAAAFGYRVNFSANLRTWDSYNEGSVSPQPGGSIGLWDLFSVNMNTQGYYWSLVDTATEGPPPVEVSDTPAMFAAAVSASVASNGLLADPLLPTVPAGSVVLYANNGSNSGALPGTTWAWGGRDYAAGLFESIRSNHSFTLAANAPVYVSLVLDSRSPADTDTSYPSWGQFSAVDQFSEVPGGGNGEAPGANAGNPLLPVDGNPEDGVFSFEPYAVGEAGVGTETFLFVDPVVAIGYEYGIEGGLKATELLLPTLGDADGYDIEVLEGRRVDRGGPCGRWRELQLRQRGGRLPRHRHRSLARPRPEQPGGLRHRHQIRPGRHRHHHDDGAHRRRAGAHHLRADAGRPGRPGPAPPPARRLTHRAAEAHCGAGSPPAPQQGLTMILELADIRIQPGQQAAFDAAIQKGIAEVASQAKGFRGFKVNKGVESPERYILMIFWETLEDHTVGFRQGPLFAQWRAIVGPFFAVPPQVEHFTLLAKS